jgi:hypothetical protein
MDQFKRAFEGVIYRHRDNSIGNKIVEYLYEDLHAHAGPKLSERIEGHSRVLNPKNESPGIRARHGDGSFGVIVPGFEPIIEEGYRVARGPTATVEIGTEIKIIAKAMSKNIGRTMSVLRDQAKDFKNKSPDAITVGIVGVNHAPEYVSYEGERSYATTGKGDARHPIQEAPATVERLHRDVESAFDEFLVIRFSATNISPYPFAWVDERATRQQYGAMVARVLSEYERRF